jgi:hypothetical protein
MYAVDNTYMLDKLVMLKCGLIKFHTSLVIRRSTHNVFFYERYMRSCRSREKKSGVVVYSIDDRPQERFIYIHK